MPIIATDCATGKSSKLASCAVPRELVLGLLNALTDNGEVSNIAAIVDGDSG